MKYYAVSEEELKELLVCRFQLNELERDGVGSWEWFGESYKEYLAELAYQENINYKDINEIDYETIAESYLLDYPEAVVLKQPEPRFE